MDVGFCTGVFATDTNNEGKDCCDGSSDEVGEDVTWQACDEFFEVIHGVTPIQWDVSTLNRGKFFGYHLADTGVYQ